MPARARRALALAASLALACEPSPGTDESGEHPRVVSLTPIASRFVLALGAGGALVGVDAGSNGLPGLEALPTVDLAGADAHEPGLVLLPELPEPIALRALERRGARVVEFAPHDLEDAIALVRDVGTALVGAERALAFERTLSRPLAAIGGASDGQPRPRVVAVVDLDPLRVAGGHSFETDLIEIAGGHSVTHPGEEHRVALRADGWADLAPDLVLYVSAAEPPPGVVQALQRSLGDATEVASFQLDEAFWLGDAAEPARRLRPRIEALSRRLD